MLKEIKNNTCSRHTDFNLSVHMVLPTTNLQLDIENLASNSVTKNRIILNFC